MISIYDYELKYMGWVEKQQKTKNGDRFVRKGGKPSFAY